MTGPPPLVFMNDEGWTLVNAKGKPSQVPVRHQKHAARKKSNCGLRSALHKLCQHNHSGRI
jgi:hypothetical protein